MYEELEFLMLPLGAQLYALDRSIKIDDFRALPTEMLCCIADEYRAMACRLQDRRFLLKAEAVEALAGQRDAVEVRA